MNDCLKKLFLQCHKITFILDTRRTALNVNGDIGLSLKDRKICFLLLFYMMYEFFEDWSCGLLGAKDRS